MITSHKNPLIKRIKRLRQRKYRKREQATFVEGLRVVLTAVDHIPAQIELLVYAPDLLTSETAQEKLAAFRDAGGRIEPVSAEIFSSLSERDNPRGLGALLRLPQGGLDQLTVAPDSLFVALVDVADPGNLGTIARTLDGAGGSGLLLVGETTDGLHPAALKASMGTLLTLPLVSGLAAQDLLRWAREHGVATVATSANAARVVWEERLQRPLLLLMGSEKHGLPEELLAACDHQVKLPMLGEATSLNLGVATGILLYEMVRRGQ